MNESGQEVLVRQIYVITVNVAKEDGRWLLLLPRKIWRKRSSKSGRITTRPTSTIVESRATWMDPPESNVVIRAEIFLSRLYVDKQDQGSGSRGKFDTGTLQRLIFSMIHFPLWKIWSWPLGCRLFLLPFRQEAVKSESLFETRGISKVKLSRRISRVILWI